MNDLEKTAIALLRTSLPYQWKQYWREYIEKFNDPTFDELFSDKAGQELEDFGRHTPEVTQEGQRSFVTRQGRATASLILSLIAHRTQSEDSVFWDVNLSPRLWEAIEKYHSAIIASYDTMLGYGATINRDGEWEFPPVSVAAATMGRKKSEKKTAAARENSKKAGRPRTSPLTRQEQQRESARKRRAKNKTGG